MKVRFVNNNIRIRLRKSDFKTLFIDKKVSISIGFPNGQKLYYLLRLSSTKNIEANFDNNTLTINIPKVQARTWINSDEVSITQEIELDDSKMLKLLLEKDFPCRHTHQDQKEDTFYELVPDEAKN